MHTIKEPASNTAAPAANKVVSTNKQSEAKASVRVGGASSFDYLTLSLFAERPQSTAQLLRSQHSEMLMMFAKARELITGNIDEALQLKNLLTNTIGCLHLHLQLERGVLGKQMASDPRARALSDQFERELAPIRASVSEWCRRFPTPSAIASNPQEFRGDTEKILRTLEERFRQEERDLYVEFERLVGA